MIANDKFYETLALIPHEHRLRIRLKRNPQWFRGSVRDNMFRELPQNPLRIVEAAAEVARDSFLWESVEWGIDSESCWEDRVLEWRVVAVELGLEAH